jgi:tetratricopeptide (TPR) repeat protein
MRLALLVASSYERCRDLPRLVSPLIDAELVSERLAEKDAGFVVDRLPAGPQLWNDIEQTIRRRAGDERVDALLLYFSGHVRIDAEGAVRLALDSTKGHSLPVARLRKLRKRAKATLFMFDLVHAPDAEAIAPSAQVLASLRDALDLKKTRLSALVAARPSDQIAPGGPSLFTRLALQTLDGLAERGPDVTADSAYAAMRDDTDRFYEIPAAAYLRGQRDFPLLAPRRASTRPSARPPSGGDAALRSRPPPSTDEVPRSHPPTTDDVSRSAPPPSVESAPRSRPVAPEWVIGAPKRPAPAAQAAVAPQRAAAKEPDAPDAAAPDVPALVEAGDRAVERGQHDEAVAEYRRALLLLGTRRTNEHRDLYVKIGEARRRAGNEVEALSNFDKALAIDPLHAPAFEASLASLRAQNDFARIERLYTRRLEALKDEDERAAVYGRIAELWLDQAKDIKKGVEALERWLALAPTSLLALERLVAAQTELGRHTAAVATRRKLAAALTNDDRERARVLADAARVAAEHFPNKAEAVALARQALEADGLALDALEVAASVLGKQRRWKELAELYDGVLERARDPKLAWDLAKKIGTIHRDELDDAKAAIRYFSRASSNDREDVELYYWLSELHEAEGDRPAAASQFRAASFHAPGRADVFRRALWLFDKTGEVDSAWNAASVLEELGDADINESLLADAHRPEGLISAQASLEQRDWEVGHLFPERDRALSAVLNAIASPAIAAKIAELDEQRQLPELDAATRQDPTTTTTMLARSLLWSARLLGIETPALYVWPEVPGELAVVPARQPTAVASRALGSGLGLEELAFLWGRHLGYYRPEHHLLSYYPSLKDLGALLLAALAIAGETADDEPTSVAGEAVELRTRLEALLDEPGREALAAAVAGFEPKNTRRRLIAWARNVHLACGRMGLLACGDVRRAAELVRRFPPQGDLEAREQIGDLCAYSISRPYAELRERLGVQVTG